MAAAPIISWHALEHHHTEKTSDWYWSVGIIAATAAALAFIFGNVIFGILIIVGTTALLLASSKHPRLMYCEINDRGVVMGDILYPFLTLESFWIDPHQHPSKILIKSQKVFMPYITVHIDDVDPEEVREVLLNYIAETQHHEPLTQKILEYLGF
ncbi:MAG: protein of unknown function with transrane region [Candidatus Taylorbacteria bacterium]|nr:protein of unknown function with transrane region [Candidatus Taylorbacteria bacterium]